jgi:hypothetical protein
LKHLYPLLNNFDGRGAASRIRYDTGEIEIFRRAHGDMPKGEKGEEAQALGVRVRSKIVQKISWEWNILRLRL